MTSSIVARNDYDSLRNVRLVVDVDGMRVSRWQLVPCESDKFHAVDSRVDTLARQLDYLFTWLGMAPDMVEIVEAPEDTTVRTLYELIYAMPFPSDVRLLKLYACLENMGNCNHVVRADEPLSCATWGDAFRELSRNNEYGQFEDPNADWCWMVPDMGNVYVDQHEPGSSILLYLDDHYGGTCHAMGVPRKLNNGSRYIGHVFAR